MNIGKRLAVRGLRFAAHGNKFLPHTAHRIPTYRTYLYTLLALINLANIDEILSHSSTSSSAVD